MRQFFKYGSVRGAARKGGPYRDLTTAEPPIGSKCIVTLTTRIVRFASLSGKASYHAGRKFHFFTALFEFRQFWHDMR